MSRNLEQGHNQPNVQPQAKPYVALFRMRRTGEMRSHYAAFSLIVTGLYILTATTVLTLDYKLPCDKPIPQYLLIGVILALLRTVVTFPDDVRALAGQGTKPVSVVRGSLETIGSMAWFVWFIFGTIWVFTADTCNETSPRLYAVTYFWIMYSLIIAVVPFLLSFLGMFFACCCAVPMLFMLLPSSAAALVYGVTNRGLKVDEIKRIPTVDASEVEDQDCPICQQHMETNLKKLDCGHGFHSECIYTWLLMTRSCPVCGVDVVPPPRGGEQSAGMREEEGSGERRPGEGIGGRINIQGEEDEEATQPLLGQKSQ